MIQSLSVMDGVPVGSELPDALWARECTLGDKYQVALDIQEQDAADVYLLALVGHSLRYRMGKDENGFAAPMTWRQAFEYERETLAWFALAVDVSRHPRRIGEYPVLDRVGRLYGAFLPESAGVRRLGMDIIAREIVEGGEARGQQISVQAAKARARRERAAKVAGIVPPPMQSFSWE